MKKSRWNVIGAYASGIPDEEDERYAECIEFAKEQLQKEDVVEEQTSGEES